MADGISKIKIAAVVILILLSGIPLTGCDAEPEETTEPVTVTMVAGSVGREFEVLKEQVAIFEAEHPDIRIELIEIPESSTERHAACVAALEREDPTIDVYMIDVIWAPEFGAKGWTIPLDDYVAAAGIDMDDFLPVSVQASTWDGKLISIPWFTAAGLLYYRRDLLDQYGFDVPQTWAELSSISETIVEQERADAPQMVGFVFQGRQYEGLVCNYLEYVWGNGADVLSEDGDRVVLDDPRAVEALETFVSMTTIAPVGVTVFQEEDALNYFRSGNAVFMRNWPYAWALLTGDVSPVREVTSIAPLPHGPEGDQGPSTMGDWQLGISAYSRHPDEAFELIAFLTGLDQQVYKAVHAAHLPTRRAAYEDPDVLMANPYFAQVLDVLINTRLRPVHPRYSDISDTIQHHVHDVLAGQEEADAATEAMADEIQRIISAGEQEGR